MRRWQLEQAQEAAQTEQWRRAHRGRPPQSVIEADHERAILDDQRRSETYAGQMAERRAVGCINCLQAPDPKHPDLCCTCFVIAFGEADHHAEHARADDARTVRTVAGGNFEYVGRRPEVGGATVLVLDERGAVVGELPARQDVRNHSPDGFQWGYGGSGPAQLALALCIHALDGDVERAQNVYQEYKFKNVARWQSDEFRISKGEVLAAIWSIESRRSVRV